MNPTRYYQHQHRTDHRGNDNRPELRLNHIKVKHQGYPGRHEKEAQIGYQEIREPLHPLQSHPSHLQEHGKQEHADDAGRKLHASQINNDFSQGQTTE